MKIPGATAPRGLGPAGTTVGPECDVVELCPGDWFGMALPLGGSVCDRQIFNLWTTVTADQRR